MSLMACLMKDVFNCEVNCSHFRPWGPWRVSASTRGPCQLGTAKITCFVAGVIYPAFGLPSIIIGAAAASTGNEVRRRGAAGLSVFT